VGSGPHVHPSVTSLLQGTPGTATSWAPDLFAPLLSARQICGMALTCCLHRRLQLHFY